MTRTFELGQHLKDIKILVVSALPWQQLEEALKAGADDILEKPFENKILGKKVRRLSGLDEEPPEPGSETGSH